MYKILIVDDEEIEREGMAEFIPWEQYGFQLVGTAWNGVEGFEKIQTECPDIVLTDIKMPVMNGIELIKKTKENFPDIEFVVLSGYGEYEFTSKAMEEGVRYYILKPCDEDKIMDVLEKVKIEIEEKREKQQREFTYHRNIDRLLPRVKDHIFQNMLLNREQPKENYSLFLKELGDREYKIQVLALKVEEGFDYLEQFIMGSIIRTSRGRNSSLIYLYWRRNVIFIRYKSKKGFSCRSKANGRRIPQGEDKANRCCCE